MNVTLRKPFLSDGANDERVRRAWASILRSWAGLGPKGAGERLEAYAATVYPHDERGKAIAMALSQSTCALTTLRACERLGARAPWLEDPYVKHLGKAVGFVVTLFRELGQWTHAGGSVASPGPYPGCAALIGGTNGELEHLTNVVGEQIDVKFGTVFECVDGGQRDVDGPDDDTLPDGAIQTVWRQFRPYGSSLVAWKLTRRPDGTFCAAAPGRRVNGFGDVATLRLDASADLDENDPSADDLLF